MLQLVDECTESIGTPADTRLVRSSQLVDVVVVDDVELVAVH